MQDITPLMQSEASRITHYGADALIINAQTYTTPVLVLSNRCVAWSVQEKVLQVADMHTLATLIKTHDPQAELCLLGTGTQFLPLMTAQRAPLLQAGMALEVMDTAAACRTFNVLLAEGRRVVAALWI